MKGQKQVPRGGEATYVKASFANLSKGQPFVTRWEIPCSFRKHTHLSLQLSFWLWVGPKGPLATENRNAEEAFRRVLFVMPATQQTVTVPSPSLDLGGLCQLNTYLGIFTMDRKGLVVSGKSFAAASRPRRAGAPLYNRQRKIEAGAATAASPWNSAESLLAHLALEPRSCADARYTHSFSVWGSTYLDAGNIQTILV